VRRGSTACARSASQAVFLLRIDAASPKDVSGGLSPSIVARDEAPTGCAQFRPAQLCLLLERSRKGRWVVQRKTARSRSSRALRRIGHGCRQNRHQPVAVQQQGLNRKLRGYWAYYGITGNARALSRFRYEVQRCWRKWLSRRSPATCLCWEAFKRLLQRSPLPPARGVHSIYVT